MLPFVGHPAPEVDVGEHGDAGLVQQPFPEILGIGAAGQPAGLRHVGPRVERAARRSAGNARNRVQQRDDQIAPLVKAPAHRRRCILRTVDRFDRRPLADLRRARVRVGHPAREHRRQRPVRGEADPPTGHRPRLRRAVGDDRALEHVGELRDRLECPVRIRALGVDQPRVDLVGIDPHLRMTAQDRGDCGEIVVRQDAAGRIVRRVQDQQLRFRRDPGG